MCVVPPLFAIQLTLDDLMGQRPWLDIGNHPVTLKVKPFACGSEVDFTRRVAVLQHRRLSENPLRVTCLRQRPCSIAYTIAREIPRVNSAAASPRLACLRSRCHQAKLIIRVHDPPARVTSHG